METIETVWQLPPIMKAFMLTVSMSLLLGLGLREYYLVHQKRIVFGTTRTCMLTGLIGFVLYELQPGGLLYLSGLLVMGLWLALFYRFKLSQQQTGLIGMLLALMCYTVGPVSLTQPYWFLLTYVIAALFILNSKEKIRLLTMRMANEEVVSLAKFLVLSGVILPLTSREPIAAFLPVSIHQTWLAVVVISGISYISYLIQTYFVREKGILLVGALGGLYSSTASTIVVARRSRSYPEGSTQPAMAIILASGLMYLRLLAIVLVFDYPLGLTLLPAFMGLSALAGGLAWLLRSGSQGSPGVEDIRKESPRNPLELSAALMFSISFLAVTGVTHFTLDHYPEQGLRWMAFLTGFTDIDPFVLALVSGQVASPIADVAEAILIATISNNLLKAIYVALLSKGVTRRLAASSLLILSGLTAVYVLWNRGHWMAP